MSVASVASPRGKLWRKRRRSKGGSRSGSDSGSGGEAGKPAQKYLASRRKEEQASTGQYVGLQAAKRELAAATAAEERHRKALQEEKEISLLAAKVADGRLKKGDLPVKDIEDCTASELSTKLQDALETVSKVARVSKGLKGTCQRALKEAVSSIKEFSEALLQRTASGENRRLAAQLARMEEELALVRADLAKVRQERQQEQTPVEAQAAPLATKLAALEARLSFMEGRQLRPPLAHERRTYAQAAAAAEESPAATPKPRKVTPVIRAAPVAKEAPVTKAALAASKPQAGPKTTPAKKGTMAASRVMATKATSGPKPQTGEWETVGANKKARKAAKKAAKKKARKERRLRAPRSTAVVITLQPGGIEKGMEYAAVLRKAKEGIDLTEIGITGLRVKETRTGARKLELSGATSGPKADALAEKLRATFDAAEVKVSRPTKTADLRISGLDDSTTSGELVAAVAKVGGCPPEAVKAGNLRRGGDAMFAAVVSCPVAAAKKIADGRRLLVGWVSAQVKLLQPRPTRCFRCRQEGHVGARCQAGIDMDSRCFRCSQPGHKAGDCEATPHCLICAAKGKPAEHRAGSKACAAPAKINSKQAAPKKQPKPPQPKPGQEEEGTGMDCQ